MNYGHNSLWPYIFAQKMDNVPILVINKIYSESTYILKVYKILIQNKDIV